ncbi:MFS general substrate transporter [Tothia fuscella]|uniref:MFS general substrate transporter n=1 Tax=Tothia fuscella TaxID=1048955 RepID=A0A9P4P0X4_9PEZI|nr:MFS general substrate transporter [Tothia fuscella]
MRTKYEQELLELRRKTDRISQSSDDTLIDEPPPPPEGAKAWLFMVSAFLIEALLWGFPMSFGIFAAYYKDHENFRNDRYIPVIGTLTTGIAFLGAPIVVPIAARYHSKQRQMIWAGWAICVASLIAASFATKVWHLLVAQGIAYGLGFLILYYAMLSMLNEWFDARRGLAYGILFGAAGISGTGLPFLVQILLTKFGFAATLRAYAVALVLIIGPTLPLCRGRLSKVQRCKVEYKVLKNPVLWALLFSNLFQGLAFFLPGIYLPTYAYTLSISPARATLLLCLLNGSQILGQVLLGWLSDWVNSFFLLVVSTLSSAIIAGLLWYMATGFMHLLAFSILFGFFAGGYSVLWPRWAKVLIDHEPTELWIYGLLAFQRGVGNIAAGPISVALIKMTAKFAKENEAASFRALIYFVVITLIVSSLGALSYFCPQIPAQHKRFITQRK